ncbi:orf 10; similar to Raji LF1 [Ateline gammaherpesvirus 3]|uniref:Similar to Raji LF1 n=1 Tax=Ateline herpesvirus 3 TaxID=85618 RepID=Q9YTQ3_ATHV3|nr:orf 10; similar to Raji LF1 [Ateline gammaherpesvirus 3]AAC95534.1 orf 10; similar to Raji LF1 [Ateline gammaherpesvirus 3]
MNPSTNFIWGRWTVTVSSGLFSISNNEEIAPPATPVARPVHLPFSIESIIDKRVSHGLVPTLLQFQQYTNSVPAVFSDTSEQPCKPYVLPMFISDFINPLVVFVKGGPIILRKNELKFYIVFISPLTRTDISSFIFPPDNDTDKTLALAGFGTRIENEVNIRGTPTKTNTGSYVMLFRCEKIPLFYNIINFNVKDSELIFESLLIQEVTLNTYIMTIHMCGSPKPDQIEVQVHLNVINTPTELVFKHALPWELAPSGGSILPIYLEADKIIKPGSSVEISFSFVFNRGLVDTNQSALFVASSNHTTKYVVKPQIWYPITPLSITVYNPGNRIIFIKRGFCVAVAVPCFFYLKAPGQDCEDKVTLDSQTSSIHWSDVLIKPGEGGPIVHAHHLVLKEINFTEEPMTF